METITYRNPKTGAYENNSGAKSTDVVREQPQTGSQGAAVIGCGMAWARCLSNSIPAWFRQSLAPLINYEKA